MFSRQFIAAGTAVNEYTAFVPAPLFRKSFLLDSLPAACTADVCGLGFYEIYINGHRITKGLLAPYISNPDHITYYDRYDLMPYLQQGKNALCFMLGNGMQNAPGGQIWDFDKADFRGAPRLAFALTVTDAEGKQTVTEAGTDVKTAPSPILFDDLRCGCFYDARLEMPGWSTAGFDDSGWQNAVMAETPRGQAKYCEAEPILPYRELKAISVLPRKAAPYSPRGDVPKTPNPIMNPCREGYLYDFGENVVGVPNLKIRGSAGTQIDLQFGEALDENGDLYYSNINFYPDGFSQRDIYILKGEGEEQFTPSFTYHGARYCLVIGITPEQATPDLLTFSVCSSALARRGDFVCSDDMANRLTAILKNSDLSNFFYFPTDCPHREKNGWTGDAAVSCDQMTFLFGTENSYREWLNNMRLAQKGDGTLPGIVPTGGWGYHWGNGPAWDLALTELTYRTYLYRGDKTILEENAPAIFLYLNKITAMQTPRKTVEYGLGDWCPVTVVKAPTELTSTLICMDICRKAAFIFRTLGQHHHEQFAKSLWAELKGAVRRCLLDLNTFTAVGRCQTSQAMAIYYGAFEESERPAAFARLLTFIHEADDHMDFGLLGSRVLFRVLGDFGYHELAYHMITRPDHPSYGDFIRRGETSLPEDFHREGEEICSLNHHFMGDYGIFFAQYVAGICINPFEDNCREIALKPAFIQKLTFAESCYDTVCGKVSLRWERKGDEVEITVTVPEGITGTLHLPEGWHFADSSLVLRPAESGTFTAVC